MVTVAFPEYPHNYLQFLSLYNLNEGHWWGLTGQN